tara:strand:+ start:1194 stop:1346 length:153 start_codon:yes stop_codon:yes gene_type:complete
MAGIASGLRIDHASIKQIKKSGNAQLRAIRSIGSNLKKTKSIEMKMKMAG